MVMLDDAGTELARVDDSGTDEGTLDFTAPTDGEYTLVLTDLHRRGGPQFCYQIDVVEQPPDFRLIAETDRLAVPIGGAAGVLVTANRQNLQAPIAVSITGLPDGLTSVPTVIGPGQRAARVTVTAAADASPQSVMPLTIIGTSQVGDDLLKRRADTTTAVRSQLNGLALVPRSLTTSLAAVVTPAGPLSVSIEPGVVSCAPGLSSSVKIIATRNAGFDGEIRLTTSPDKDALPSPLKLKLKPIPSGRREVELTIDAGEDATPGTYTVGLIGTHRQDDRVTTVSVPGLSLRVEPALQLAAIESPIRISRGGETRICVSVTRHPALRGDVTLQVENLPDGVAASTVSLPEDATAGEILLRATAEAPAGPIEGALLRVTAAAHPELESETRLEGLSIE